MIGHASGSMVIGGDYGSVGWLCAADKFIKYTFYAFLPLVFVMFSIFILFTYIMFLNFRYNKENEVKRCQ